MDQYFYDKIAESSVYRWYYKSQCPGRVGPLLLLEQVHFRKTRGCDDNELCKHKADHMSSNASHYVS